MSNTVKIIQQLNLEDDFLFAKVMSDKEVCKKVLEKILGVSIREVSIPATQKTINNLYEGKGIRLDVYINHDEGTVYNVEMERGKQKKPSCPRDQDTIRETLILTSFPQGKTTESSENLLSSSYAPLIHLEKDGISIHLRTDARKVLLSHWEMNHKDFSEYQRQYARCGCGNAGVPFLCGEHN